MRESNALHSRMRGASEHLVMVFVVMWVTAGGSLRLLLFVCHEWFHCGDVAGRRPIRLLEFDSGFFDSHDRMIESAFWECIVWFSFFIEFCIMQGMPLFTALLKLEIRFCSVTFIVAVLGQHTTTFVLVIDDHNVCPVLLTAIRVCKNSCWMDILAISWV